MALKRSQLKGLGLTFLIFMLACCTVMVILAGIVYKYANPHFVETTWHAISPLLIATVVYGFFTAFMGFCVFTYPKTSILILYQIFLFVSILMSLAIGIFSIIGGSTSYPNLQYGCNAKINGILDVWKHMDSYLINVDRALCSVDCPCKIKNKADFEFNPNATAAYSTWSLSTQVFAATAFQNCSNVVLSNVLTATTTQNPSFPIDSFNSLEFADYMSRIEMEFNCVGWCSVKYISSGSSTPTTFSKYLFSDINRGPPQKLGCIEILISWLPSYLLAWGSVALVMVGIEIVLFALSIMLAGSRKKEQEGHEVVHNERIEVVERQ